MPAVIVDGSYYVFWRLHALYAWYQRARRADEPDDPRESVRVREKFVSTFAAPLETLFKREGWNISTLYVAKDCPQKEIWRHQVVKEYKAGRKARPEVAAYMTAAYQGGLFETLGPDLIVEWPGLEADDCAALLTKRLLESTDKSIIIITGDKDYLQLCCDRVQVWNMNGGGKCLDPGDAKRYLLEKILIGDKSDNIRGVCGKARADTLLAPLAGVERDEWFTDLRSRLTPEEQSTFDINHRVVAFESIPHPLRSGFLVAHAHVL